MNKAKSTVWTLCCVLAIGLAACDRLPGFAPTPTRRVSVRPTPTAPVASIADVILRPEDFPNSFRTAQPEQQLFTPGEPIGDWPIEAGFTFERISEDPELIAGFTLRVPDPIDRAAFDLAMLADAETLASVFAGEMTGDVLSSSELPGMKQVGDASAGATILYTLDGETWRAEIVGFRRRDIVAWVFALHLEGRLPLMPVNALVHKLAERAQRLVSSERATSASD
ncbi:MAG TPA: hypothetical protein VJG32_07375 [Anaerolineae bacterium]|nr:hypothetical protein [Anaerolineae bacterium]